MKMSLTICVLLITSVSVASGMAPSPEFGMEVKMNQAQKMNNKVDGTPKTETTKKVAYNKVERTPLSKKV